MTTDLRGELDALAQTQTFSPDPAAWDRGRRARRRDRVARGAAALAVVAVALSGGTLALRPSAVGPADDVAPDGAIPSVVPEPDGPVVTDLAIGSASVAYVDEAGQPVLVDATTGEALAVELPDFPVPEVFDLTSDVRRGPWLAVSPDGTRLAYPTTSREERDPGQYTFITSWYRVVDLSTGESDLVELPGSYSGTPRAMSWDADGRIAVDVLGRSTGPEEPPTEGWTVDPATGDSSRSSLTGVLAPGLGISAPYPVTTDPVDAVPFETSSGIDPSRELPADLYPDGAVVTPIGWADSSLLVARVDDDLVLLTSPDRTESEWTWQVLVDDVPDALGVSLAVDLVPDLTGDPEQPLTHDFGD